MIDYISIKNFRCFQETQIAGFGQVNLIGGLNNSGKTALLEALLLSFYTHPITFSTMISLLRNENFDTYKIAYSNPWRYLFFNQNTEAEIEIIAKEKEVISQEIRFFYTEDRQKIVEKNKFLSEEQRRDLLNYSNNFFVMTGIGKIKGEEIGLTMTKQKAPQQINEPTLNGLGRISAKNNIWFSHHALKFADENIAILYSAIDKNGKTDLFDQFLNKLDNRIKGSKITAPDGKPILELKVEGNQSFPIKLFGDAIQRSIEMLLILLTRPQLVILIDEIENGVHYTKHQEFWKILFLMAKEQGTQIFATTHSKEMIQAFTQVAEEKKEISARYFQLYKSALSGQIVAAPYESEELNYALQHNVPLRGEE